MLEADHGTNYPVIARVYKNSYIRVFAGIGNWYIVQIEGDYVGAVSKDYIKAIYPNSTGTTGGGGTTGGSGAAAGTTETGGTGGTTGAGGSGTGGTGGTTGGTGGTGGGATGGSLYRDDADPHGSADCHPSEIWRDFQGTAEGKHAAT